VRVEAVPSDGEHMTPGYHYIEERDGRTVAAPIETMRVKSLILAPRDGERRAAGVTRVTGYAWGGRPVARVEVSADGGRTWADGTLGAVLGEHAWRSWSADVTLTPGPHTLMSRATDVDDAVQPSA